MKTYRFWFVKDREFPRFMRLRCEKAEVCLRDVLTKGIHPLEMTTDVYYRDICMLPQRLVKEVNDRKHLVREPAELGYCPEVSVPGEFYYEESKLEHTLRTLTEQVFYVEKLSYAELVEVARKALAKKWDDKVARLMLQSVRVDFNSIREFLKSKDKKVKLSGYSDLDRYPLGEIVSPEDFANHERAVISHALPVTNFRSTSFLSTITSHDAKALLSLVPEIKHFEIVWREWPFRRGTALLENDVKYNCTLTGELIRFVPSLPARQDVREAARAIAQRWKTGEGNFCFTTSIEKVEEMLEDEKCQIYFSSTNYMDGIKPLESEGEIGEKHIPSFRIGEIITQQLPNESLKEVLRRYGKSMTGKKEELLEKVEDVLCERYEQMLPFLDERFRRQKYLRVLRTHNPTLFAFMQDASVVDRTVLAMYIIKHLRGNTILDASHENDTYDLEDLATALLRGEVSVSGNFVAVGDDLQHPVAPG